MLIELRDVPRRERHLLFCTDRTPVRSEPSPLQLQESAVRAALNRSRAIHDEALGRAGLMAAGDADIRATP